jgi:hypothetical protein
VVKGNYGGPDGWRTLATTADEIQAFGFVSYIADMFPVLTPRLETRLTAEEAENVLVSVLDGKSPEEVENILQTLSREAQARIRDGLRERGYSRATSTEGQSG